MVLFLIWVLNFDVGNIYIFDLILIEMHVDDDLDFRFVS